MASTSRRRHVAREADMSSKSVLEKLGLEPVNPGACWGPEGWVTEAGATPVASRNPATGDVLASYVPAGAAACDVVLAKAHERFQTWRDVPAPRRGALVRDLALALRELQEPLGDLVTLEMGKIRVEGRGEVQEMVDVCDFAQGLSRQLYGLTMPSERPGHRILEQWHPLGAIAVITAFNFPVAVWSWNASLAAVCGDTTVWKPSSSTPLCAVAVQKIANRVMADHHVDGVFTFLAGSGRTVGERLLEDERMRLVSFTGSTKMGRHVAEVVSRRFGRTILELGGNNAVVVGQSADLDMALRAILFGAVGTSGQRCTSTRRVLVHRSVARRLTDALVHAYAQVRIGDPIAGTTGMGPLVNEDGVRDMMAALERAKSEGGEVLAGGRARPDLGPLYVEPTIVRMPEQTAIVKEETFAPILYVIEVDSFEQAMAIHNGVPQGLSSSVFSNDVRETEAFLSAAGSDCGIANVNVGTSGAEIGGAFGGEKETGGGRESGSDSWKQYMRRQTNTINGTRDLPLAQGLEFRVGPAEEAAPRHVSQSTWKSLWQEYRIHGDHLEFD
ncbi:MAG TPA: aldehyde dehydrogenase family protein, partial [Planctomycetota bacterium]|nr:aldehyde dehydrogenase family protein [Planctomycetota bacterium]